MSTQWQSWGRFPRPSQQTIIPYFWRSDPFPKDSATGSYLPYGRGRSYGDSCLNDGQSLIPTRALERFISFDREAGILRCEAGVTFDRILELIVPCGWFLPVTPGTKFVSVGGAVANDVHGKNHHVAGSFGNHVIELDLLRSDGSRRTCSPTQNAELFFATIGGLGLTGLMTSVSFRLQRISSSWIDQELIRYSNLEDFFQISKESERGFAYSVAWIDCLAKGKKLGRGLFYRGNHAEGDGASSLSLFSKRKLSVPMDLPGCTLSRFSLSAFNFLYYHRQLGNVRRGMVHYDPFFYPLDGINNWNRIYGSQGFLQYQCVVPYTDGGAAIREILDRIAKQGMGSFLGVLKTFGSVRSVGMLSFPKEGVTLALDFPNRGERLFRLLSDLDRVVARASGSVYPAKDARMGPESFSQFYPQFAEFKKWMDPRFSSSFIRRVTRDHE